MHIATFSPLHTCVYPGSRMTYFYMYTTYVHEIKAWTFTICSCTCMSFLLYWYILWGISVRFLFSYWCTCNHVQRLGAVDRLGAYPNYNYYYYRAFVFKVHTYSVLRCICWNYSRIWVSHPPTLVCLGLGYDLFVARIIQGFSPACVCFGYDIFFVHVNFVIF